MFNKASVSKKVNIAHRGVEINCFYIASDADEDDSVSV